MSDEKMTPEKIKDMAKLVHLSGRISEFHEKNLKMYPYVFFDGVLEAKIEYDFSHRPSDSGPKESPKTPDEFYKEIGRAAMNMRSDSYVAYRLKINDNPMQPHMDKRFDALEKSVRSLFWNDVIVKVYFNDKIVYESRK
jgi:hypothetical protein